MNHYFTNQEISSNLKKKIIKISDKTFSFYTDSGVFSKRGLDFGSRTLIDVLLKEKLNGKILDAGCGYGIIGIVLSSFFHIETDMIDINKRAIHLANINIRENRLSNIRAFESDIYNKICDKYDVIITNPPIRAGKEIVYKFLFESKKFLNEKGTLYFVINKNQGANSVMKDLEKTADIKILKKNKGFYVFKCKF